MSIPKRIFYVWGANEEKRRDVELCLLTWKQICPEYQIIEINEESTEYFDFEKELKNNKWFKTIYENKLYAYISDYVRIKVLYDNGGIYLDTDVSLLKNFDEFIEERAFVGIQRSSSMGTSNLEPAILGAEKNNPIIKQILDFYNENIWKQPIYTIPSIFDYVLEKNYGEIFYPEKSEQQIIKLENITLYPERFFIPFRYGETFSLDCIEHETVSIHWFGGSWVKSNIKYFLQNKHKEDLRKLLKKCFGTKNIICNDFLNINRTFLKYNINIDLSFIFKFKYKYYDNNRYLTVYILGWQIRLFKTGEQK